ncbi:MAG: esterase-like activity of phytase family protein, partial [Sulfurovaceae bacterium]|nr:esterase-like activity of phytase family protein [Sulfurovaceae bacterium]
LSTIFMFFVGCTLTPLIARGTVNNKITILEQKNLYFDDRGDIPFEGLSDLTYDTKNHILYMIGDRGYLYKFLAIFDKKIEKLKYINAFHIKAPNNKIIHPDIEGLTLNPKGQLIVSFERNPRVKQITKKGKLKYNYKIPKKLRKKSIYKTRNSMFEAVAYHPKYGILIAVEYPINRRKNTHQTIYSLKGKEWNFKTESHPNSAITAIEIMDDNNILVIERAYNGISNPFYITLKKVYLNKCNKNRECKSEVLASFSSSDGWGYNNFEGLAKVGKNRFVMVSDTNGHILLSTTITYFKVNP